MSSLSIADLSIILIEPSATQLKVILKHLLAEGVHTVEGVSSGSEAWDLLQRYQPDLIISSMYLPDMTATDLFERIKNTGAFDHTEFMLISSETSRSVLEPIRQAGVVAILSKPFDPNDLKRALRSTVEFVDPERLDLEHYDIESLRILIVDDSATSRKQLAKTLSNMGIRQITMAHDGLEALEIFKRAQEAFDLIITDYNMPEIDGQELIKIIRTEMDNHFIPILMVTSEQNETRLNNIQQAGVSAICDKPFDPQTIKELMFRLLDEA
ncbi:MAG: response regulator [Gammaproteobacteria bacterium]